MNTLVKFPFYAKASLLIIGLYFFISMLSIAQDLILPLLYAIIIAILINPLVLFLERKKINRGIAIALVLLTALLILASFVILLVSQFSILRDAWPQLSAKFKEMINECIVWASHYFNISVPKINAWMIRTRLDMMDSSNIGIGSTLTTVGGVMATVLLTPVYIFMLLFYQPHLVKFTHILFGTRNDNKLNEILFETKSIVQSYLVGLFIEFIIIAILNSIGLLILGIEYAIILGILGALLNVIPYLGGMIGVALFMVIALITKSPEYVFYVVILYTVIQLIDNNYIVPKIVGSKVKLNALVSILTVIFGAALWGIPGMFLSIPLTAVIKLVFDRIDGLKPWGFLLGDTMPPLIKLKVPRKSS